MVSGMLGQVAYEAYSEKANGLSLVSGSQLPPWDVLNTSIQGAWEAAARAVVASMETPLSAG